MYPWEINLPAKELKITNGKIPISELSFLRKSEDF